MRPAVLTASEAVALIRDGDDLTTSGFVGIGVPEALLAAIETSFLTTGHPRNLGLVFAAGQGDGKDRGLNHLGHRGLLRRVVGGHFGLIPRICDLALEGAIEAWNLPQGCISQSYRDAAARRPGMLTKVGLDTFVDPRLGGGALNAASTDPLVTLHESDEDAWLWYAAPPINVALLRGSTADAAGNISMEREALLLDNLPQAMAARNAGGRVIVQVEALESTRRVPGREVHLPGALVDAVVVAPPEQHMQTFATPFFEGFANRVRVPVPDELGGPLDARKVIARRCAMELPRGGLVNLGIGMPEGVTAAASEAGLLHEVSLTAEPGVIGGRPGTGLDFGAAVNADAVLPQHAQFDLYDGGGLDLAILGMAQVDAEGNVNVSRFGGRLAGAGGFINISQAAKALVFAGTFTAGGLEIRVQDGRVSIDREGKRRKFLRHVEEITFAGTRARRLGQPVVYVTERCVFRLTSAGLRLVEVAPGIDVEHDILAHMAFRPIINDPTPMDARLFRPEPLHLT